MSTAGKRRAEGPATTKGRRTKGGARKATNPSGANPSGGNSAQRTPSNLIPTQQKSRAGRSVTTAGSGDAPSWVREDQHLALRAAVEALGEPYVPGEWSFDGSSLLLTAARRITPTGGGHDLLVISNECYTGWVPNGQDPSKVAEVLAQSAPLAHTQIEWLLDGEVRFGVGPWLLRPVGRRGWVATRRTRTRTVFHFVVDAAGDYTPVHSDDRASVNGALVALAAVRDASRT